jgi:DNA-binding transcriptional LysR family regulator
MHISHKVLAAALAPDGLGTFLGAYRAGSISAAAEVLHLSQPAISRRLQGLERQLGAPLFDRLPNGLRLTAAGRVLLPHAERILAAVADAAQAVAEHRDRPIGKVSTGVVGSLIEPHITHVLRVLVGDHPEMEIDVTTGTSAQVCDGVRRGELDLGVTYAQVADADLELRTIARERLVVVCAPDAPHASERLRGNELRRHRWLVFPDRPSQPETSGTIARRTLEAHHVPAARLRPIDSLSAQLALARSGYGFALLPDSMAGPEVAAGRLAVVDAPALHIEVPITLCTRRSAHHSPAAAAIIELLRRATGE